MKGGSGGSPDGLPGLLKQRDQGGSPFFGTCKVYGCLYFGEHGARREMAFFHILPGFVYRQIAKPFLLWLSKVDRHFFNRGQDDEIIRVQFFGKQAAGEIFSMTALAPLR